VSLSVSSSSSSWTPRLTRSATTTEVAQGERSVVPRNLSRRLASCMTRSARSRGHPHRRCHPHPHLHHVIIDMHIKSS
jgi:hypothetical protein